MAKIDIGASDWHASSRQLHYGHLSTDFTFKALEVNFLSAYFFQEYQDKCSSAINEVKIDLL